MFSKEDIGCYADGVFGHQHCREILAQLLEENDKTPSAGVIVHALRQEMSDDAWEEYEALDRLNEYFCVDGIYFEFDNGNLFLSNSEDDDIRESFKW